MIQIWILAHLLLIQHQIVNYLLTPDLLQQKKLGVIVLHLHIGEIQIIQQIFSLEIPELLQQLGEYFLEVWLLHLMVHLMEHGMENNEWCL